MNLLPLVVRLRLVLLLLVTIQIAPTALADAKKTPAIAKPTLGVDVKSPEYCGACHPRILEEWKSSEMGRDLDNPVVYQFYTATNARGEKDGRGYRGKHPDKAGECADCHVPDLVLQQHKKTAEDVDLGVAMREKSDHGISCYFCHTMSDVKTPLGANGKYPERIFQKVTQDPRRRIHGPRGKTGKEFHPSGTVKGALVKSSQMCSACHLNQEENVIAISTPLDWEKAVKDGHTTETCQGCHMPLHSEAVEVAVGQPKRTGVRSHVFPGSHDKTLLEKALDLKLDAGVAEGVVTVNTIVENVGAGHRVPGSGPIRHVLLKIDVTDDAGKPLAYAGDPKGLLPPLAGMGNPQTKQRGPLDWAGMPGRFYGKVLASAVDPKTGQRRMGVGGFDAEIIAVDTTLEPKKPDAGRFQFKLDPAYKGKVNVSAQLVYRWSYKPLADSKGWKLEDRPMKSAQATVVVGG